MVSGGMQMPGGGTGDDGYDEDGYDESQRAEILEATGGGPSDGTIITDLSPDLGADDDVDDLADDDGLTRRDARSPRGDAGPDDDEPSDDDPDDDDDDEDDDDDDVGMGDDDEDDRNDDADEENENA